MNYGVAIFPSKQLQDKVNSYRKRYDPNYALISPHITLKYTFFATESEIETVAEQLKNIAKSHKPFKLNVVKPSTFQPVNNTIFFKVELNPELESLHKEMNHADFFGGPSPYAFVPHITIGQKLSDDEHSDVLGQIRMLDVTHEEEVDRFHLLYQLENGSWTVYETFRLGEEE
ncbi:YjcG family protein [Peribacillus sp. JNUCC 23]|uniref:YjcG family protein n=1 Tax=Peribacillus sp. NPDC096379 TaxID=3364393 RepID=UPI0007865095